MEPKILGIFEKIDFPQFGINSVKAKVDSGAFIGAIHCTKVKLDKTGRKPVLHFSPFDHPDIRISTEDYKIRNIKSSNGLAQDRYLIKTFITIQGETYPIQLTLADRTKMDWPVLIGRRFLAKNHFLVDVNKGLRLTLTKQKILGREKFLKDKQ